MNMLNPKCDEATKGTSDRRETKPICHLRKN
jgi:hypothetical protein